MNLAKLETLWLNNTHVTDAGMVYLKPMAALKTVDLNFTKSPTAAWRT